MTDRQNLLEMLNRAGHSIEEGKDYIELTNLNIIFSLDNEDNLDYVSNDRYTCR